MLIWASGFNGRENVAQTGFVRTVSGVTSSQTLSGYDVILDPALMKSEWDEYQVSAPLSRVWGDDNPAEPTETVQLFFPDVDTAKAVLAGFWWDDGL